MRRFVPCAVLPLLIPRTSNGPLVSGTSPCAFEEDRLAAILDRVEQLLRRQPTPVDDLHVVAAFANDFGSLLSVGRAFLIIAFIVEAFRIPMAPVSWPRGSDPSVYAKVGLLRKALLVAGPTVSGRQRDGDKKKGPALDEPECPSAGWLQAARAHRPRADALPQVVLSQLGCKTAGASSVRSLAHLLAFNHTETDSWFCNKDWSYFQVGMFHRIPDVKSDLTMGLFTALLPYLTARPVLDMSHHDMVRWVLDHYLPDPTGLFLEFGVWRGESLKMIAKRLQNAGGGVVFGFDSFRGLPAAWQPWRGDVESTFPAGYYRVKAVPRVEHNARLVVGLYNRTLPAFLQRWFSGDGMDDGTLPARKKLRFIHIDSDLYSSTKDVLVGLAPYISPGCVLIFDDLINIGNLAGSAFGAFAEFMVAQPSFRVFQVLAAPWAILGGEDVHPVFNSSWGAQGVNVASQKYVALRVVK